MMMGRARWMFPQDVMVLPLVTGGTIDCIVNRLVCEVKADVSLRFLPLEYS